MKGKRICRKIKLSTVNNCQQKSKVCEPGFWGIDWKGMGVLIVRDQDLKDIQIDIYILG